MRRAVFLDRDGVLNAAVVRDHKPYPPVTLAELKIFPDAPAQLQRLRERGYLLILVTNQPDVARGTQPREIVDQMNSTVSSALSLDDVFVCFHDDADACSCRKPFPGLLFSAAERHEIDLPRSFLIGDRWRDIDAGVAAGCQTVLIDRGYRERAPEHSPDSRVPTLAAAVDWILRNS